MRTVIQRVTRARVVVEAQTVGEIETGLLLLVGLEKGDGGRDVAWQAEKIAALRIFGDSQGRMNRSLADVDGAVLAVSQFTLAGSLAKGRRPGFDGAMEPAEARLLFERFVEALRALGVPTQTGVFGAMMQVELANDGPVTFVLDSRREAG